MDSIDETLLINRLLDFYGKLLTNSQYEIMTDYYNFNLSLGEISEERNISRTAVQDAIKTATKKLKDYEEKLQFCTIFDSFKDGKNDEIINKLEEKIKNGI